MTVEGGGNRGESLGEEKKKFIGGRRRKGERLEPSESENGERL